MGTATTVSDKRFGLTILFSLLTLIGVVGMLAAGFTGDQLLAAGGFALAVIAASFAVSANHIYS
ncbi:DUF7525 family protein [Haloquadratum walsbyi]|uniref:Uncharacterized protein n=1 Tax=Haloquadratum walsbyi (strain DSM 16854 / JCM 12705 / C23) TaxID=768065 RepID=G0LJF0_HALWC|nr:hypothetical protein [Haloquadratum walsbyi]CCC40884.1 uncharacterized protein Hqrw_3097 [Haloquadratum walsbyi C23]